MLKNYPDYPDCESYEGYIQTFSKVHDYTVRVIQKLNNKEISLMDFLYCEMGMLFTYLNVALVTGDFEAVNTLVNAVPQSKKRFLKPHFITHYIKTEEDYLYMVRYPHIGYKQFRRIINNIMLKIVKGEEVDVRCIVKEVI